MSKLESLEELRDYASVYIESTKVKSLHDRIYDLAVFADEIQAEIDSHYMRLPVDADGVPIRHGDTIAHAGLSIGPIDVISIGAEGDWVVGRDGNTWELTGDEVHVQPRTLEDVLSEMLDRNGDGIGLREFNGDFAAFVEHYADEIRELLGSDGEC